MGAEYDYQTTHHTKPQLEFIRFYRTRGQRQILSCNYHIKDAKLNSENLNWNYDKKRCRDKKKRSFNCQAKQNSNRVANYNEANLDT